MSDNFPTIKLEILTIADASSQLIDFYDRSKRGKRIVFPIDYSLISGYIRTRSSTKPRIYDRGFDRDVDHIGRRIFELYSEHATHTPYTLAFSQPTVLEFESSSVRMKNDLISITRSKDIGLEATYDAVMKYVDSKGSLKTFDDQALYKRAKSAFDVMSRTFERSPTTQLLNMINSGHVKGLGAFYSTSDFNNIKQQIYASAKIIWDYLNQYRHGADFHYFNNLIDALNFSITHHLDQIPNGVSLSYVAPFPDISRHNRQDPMHKEIQSLVGKRAIPATLLLDLSSRHFMSRSSNPDKNANEWVLACFDRAKTCRQYIKHVDSASEMSEPKQRELNLFYKEYMVPTFKNGRIASETDSTFEEARTFFSDKEAFRRRFEEGAAIHDELETGLKGLEPVIESDELLSDMGLMDDPRILAIRKGLNRPEPI